MNHKSLLTLTLIFLGASAQAQPSPPSIPRPEQSRITHWNKLELTSPQGKVVTFSHADRELRSVNASGKPVVRTLPVTLLRRIEDSVTTARREPFPREGQSQLRVRADNTPLSSPNLRTVSMLLHAIAHHGQAPSSPDQEPIRLVGLKAGKDLVRRKRFLKDREEFKLAFPTPGLKLAFDRLETKKKVSLVVYPFSTGSKRVQVSANGKRVRVQQYDAVVVDLVLLANSNSGLSDPNGSEIVWVDHEQDPSHTDLLITDSKGRRRTLRYPEKTRSVSKNWMRNADATRRKSEPRPSLYRPVVASQVAPEPPPAATTQPNKQGIAEALGGAVTSPPSE